jgi:single-stranded DNA-binding protein
LPNGTSVVKFSVATKRSWKDTNDEWQERTQWHQVVVIWNRTGFQARFSFEASFKEFMTAASDCSQ